MSQQQSSLPPRTAARQSTNQSKQKQKKRRPVLKTSLILLFGLLILVAATIAYLYVIANDAIGDMQIGVDDEEQQEITVPAKESVKNKAVAFAILGLDSRENGGGLNTDVMMVAALNPDTKKAVVVSIPRDAYISADGYKARKANGFYAALYNQAISEKLDKTAAKANAMQHMRTMLGNYFDIDIKYTTTINFKGFTDVIDALGGVEVNVDMRMKYTDNADGTRIDLQPGFQKLTGDQALDYVRYRKSNDGKNMSSDFDRNKRQGEVVGAMVDRMVSLGGIFKINKVVDAVSSNVKIDMPKKEIENMLKTYSAIKRSDITFITLDGNWRSPYVYIDDSSLSDTKSQLQSVMGQ